MVDTNLIYSVGAKIVGATLLWTGIIKAIEPDTFRQHLASLGWIARKRLNPAVSASAALETALGAALIVGIFPRILYPASILVLAAFTAVTWWSVRSGKVEDCGCYGGYIQPSLFQSIGINALFTALVIVALLLGPRNNSGWEWKLVTVLILTSGVGILAAYAQRFAAREGRPLVDRNPLKVGKRWKHSWANGLSAGFSDEFLVGLLGIECPYCGKFVKVANAMTQSPSLPPVVGVVAANEARASSYIAEKEIRFPVARISQSLMSRLATGVPTAILVKGDRIDKVWVGDMPPDFVDRFLSAFFPQLDSLRAATQRRITPVSKTAGDEASQ